MDIGKAFTFMFEDPAWQRKLGIGLLVVLVGLVLIIGLIGIIPLLIVMGYSLDVTRNVLDRRQYPLPEWEDWGRLFMRGLKLVVVQFVWVLPALLVAIPAAIGGAMTNQNSAFANSLGGLLIACATCLGFLWGLVVLLFTPAIYIRLAETDEITSGFDFRRLWEITRNNLSNVIVATLLVILAGLIAAIVGSAGIIALGIGLLVTIPAATLWQYLVQAHLYGQVGVVGTRPGMTPPAPPTPPASSASPAPPTTPTTPTV